MRAETAPSTKIEVGLATAFGCTIQGAVPEDDVVRLAQACVAAGVDSVALADTVGYANPSQVRRLFTRVRAEIGDRLEAGHFHDTRGLGLANVMAALGAGVRCFDSSLAGLGGCPFAPGATGNVVFEDLVFLCESKGFATGIDIEKLIAVRSILRAEMPGEALYGGLARAGLPAGRTSVAA